MLDASVLWSPGRPEEEDRSEREELTLEGSVWGEEEYHWRSQDPRRAGLGQRHV